MLCIVAKRYILQVNINCFPSNMILQLSTPYTDRNRQTTHLLNCVAAIWQIIKNILTVLLLIYVLYLKSTLAAIGVWLL